ncbi:flagellar hook-basal body complex protein FliE [Roseovarius salis]|uniref:flagellar hook-basal body complex protein FliE n=1 Tax=Roseovarius salis TaxID=3376063 RepID=UPI0037C5B5A7
MDIGAIGAAQKYAAARPATEPNAGQPATGGTVNDLARDFATTLQQSEELSKQAIAGDADPHALVEALAHTELAVKTAVTVRDKVVEAYREILRMPV